MMKKYLSLILSQKEIIWEFIKKLTKEIFLVSLVSFLFFYLIDNFKPNFISDYFNLNILLIITIISGVFSVLFQREEKKIKPAKVKVKDYFFIIVLGLIAAGLIYFKIKDLGWLAYAIAPISGIIIVLLSILLFHEQEDDDQPNKN